MATSDGDGRCSDKFETDDSWSMKLAITSMKLKWPSVQNVSTGDLQQRLANEHQTVVVLDTRPEEEYRVSHIDGAQRVDPEARDVHETYTNIVTHLTGEKDAAVVCYCSIGYRSSKYAQAFKQKLEKEGMSQGVSVYNLEGSLFKWANENRPLVDSSQQRTVLCHPYNSFWGKLLKAEIVYKPLK